MSSRASSIGRPRAPPSSRRPTASRRWRTVAAATAVHGIASLPDGIPVETVGAVGLCRPGSRSRACAACATSSRSTSSRGCTAAPSIDPCPSPCSALRGRARRSPCGSWPRCCCRASCAPWSSTSRSCARRLTWGWPSTRCATSRSRATCRWSSGTSSTPPSTACRWAGSSTSSRRWRTDVFATGRASIPLGGAIFVFAGGTVARFEDFISYGDERAERAAKKPDFVSRLRGYVDVTGPNRRGPADVAWPLRRALLLRSLIARRAPQMMRAERRGAAPRDRRRRAARLPCHRRVHSRRALHAGHRRDEHLERQAPFRALEPAGAPAAGAACRRRGASWSSCAADLARGRGAVGGAARERLHRHGSCMRAPSMPPRERRPDDPQPPLLY